MLDVLKDGNHLKCMFIDKKTSTRIPNQYFARFKNMFLSFLCISILYLLELQTRTEFIKVLLNALSALFIKLPK